MTLWTGANISIHKQSKHGSLGSKWNGTAAYVIYRVIDDQMGVADDAHTYSRSSPNLTANAFFHSLARGIFSQMEHWWWRIEGEINWWERIGISLYPRQNFLTYYSTRMTVVAYYKLAMLQFVAYYKHFSLITGSRLLYIYMYIYIFICIYMYTYI